MPIGNNNYYLLGMSDQTMYTVETFTHIKGWFGKMKEFTIGVKQLPINSIVLRTMLEYLKLKISDVKELSDGTKNEKYEILDLKKVRKELDNMFKTIEQDRFKITNISSNDTVKELVNEGYSLLAVETIGSSARQLWLVKSNTAGILHISTVLLVGKVGVDELATMNTFVFTQELVENIFKTLEGESK